MDIKEITEKFPVGSQLNKLIVELIEGGYFDFRITSNRRNLFANFLKHGQPLAELSEKYLISNARVRQLITNTLGVVASFVLKNQDELQVLYNNSLKDEGAKELLQNYCYNISPYYQKIYKPTPPEQKNPLEPLEFSIKVTNLLQKFNINNVEDLREQTANKLLNIHRMGTGTLNEIRNELAKHGLKLKDD